jgi:hypothetical protein
MRRKQRANHLNRGRHNAEVGYEGLASTRENQEVIVQAGTDAAMIWTRGIPDRGESIGLNCQLNVSPTHVEGVGGIVDALIPRGRRKSDERVAICFCVSLVYRDALAMFIHSVVTGARSVH